MDPLEGQFGTLSLYQRSLATSSAADLVESLTDDSTNEILTKMDIEGSADIDDNVISSSKKVGPIVPPKPYRKKENSPEVPQSCFVKQISEPHYSKRLQSFTVDNATNQNMPSMVPILHRNHPVNALHKTSTNNVTLDNPIVLEQQLEALAHHKRELEKKGMFVQQQRGSEKSATDVTDFHKHLANSQAVDDYTSDTIYSNIRAIPSILNSPASSHIITSSSAAANTDRSITKKNEIYSNMMFEDGNQDDIPPQLSSELSFESGYSNHNNDEETPPPPSPVSSSYSELRRATDVFKKPYHNCYIKAHETSIACSDNGSSNKGLNESQYINMNCNNEFNGYCSTLQTANQDTLDFYSNGSSSQASSTYESIYEPIIPRPASQLSSHANYLNYIPYSNETQMNTSESGGSISTIGSISTSEFNTPSFPNIDAGGANVNLKSSCQQKEIEVEALTEFLVHSLDTGSGVENYGTCYKCNERVLGENSGCTAMEQVYHIACFTCTQCKVNLQGKPFYALDGKPFCEYDYLQTLEKCSVCTSPILERILRATGKPYHPQCFTCVICGKSLDGIPFTVDATNQNYCISDFHKKFAPRCCVCMEPIMPEPGEEETVRVVALDRSFHFECYKCEDCGLLLSSEAEGRGCYPLDGHVLCKSCNAKRVQMLTSRTCYKCNERVLGENSGCTAMEQVYHIACFTCTQCKVNLQGKPFYALDGKPFCEYDYLQTLEKCSVCTSPILERILRATGKPYHPQCFTCVICGKSLDGIPFTVDATNQNYCISDFHKKFAPRCCVCMEPIMPEPGEEETVRVVALDRSFHFECYKCEDCGLLLSSEAEGRGCYPLDGHVLCKSCNAKRVQMLTSRMTTEL